MYCKMQKQGVSIVRGQKAKRIKDNSVDSIKKRNKRPKQYRQKDTLKRIKSK